MTDIPANTFLCRLADLDATGGKDVVIDDAGVRLGLFVVRWRGAVHGYVNSCPHARLPLNWKDDSFFDLSRNYLLCANHGAFFDVATGACVRGPCKGQSLRRISIRIEGDAIMTA